MFIEPEHHRLIFLTVPLVYSVKICIDNNLQDYVINIGKLLLSRNYERIDWIHNIHTINHVFVL